jgi:hypothetical protein
MVTLVIDRVDKIGKQYLNIWTSWFATSMKSCFVSLWNRSQKINVLSSQML